MDFRLVARQSAAPLVVGAAGGIAGLILAGKASAVGFAGGALLVAVAVLVSGGFYARARSLNAVRVLIRIAFASLLKLIVVLGGAAWVLSRDGSGGVSAAAFTCGVIAGLVSTLFNTVQRSTGASTS